MTVEREVKLAVGPMFQLPDLSEVVPGATSQGESPLRFVASYYDTPDLRLARWGCSLRYRTGEGWSVKLPIDVSNGRFERDERSFEAGPGRPPEAAVDLVRAYVRTAPLRLAVRLQTLRRRVEIVDADQGPVAVARRTFSADRRHDEQRLEQLLVRGSAEVQVQGGHLGQVARVDRADDRPAAGAGLEPDQFLDLEQAQRLP